MLIKIMMSIKHAYFAAVIPCGIIGDIIGWFSSTLILSSAA
jgi:hypothetical protein